MAVIAALDHPLRSGAAGDDADVMAPYDNGPNTRPAGVVADRGPVPRKPKVATRHTEMLA
jgi:hypothetical protein